MRFHAELFASSSVNPWTASSFAPVGEALGRATLAYNKAVGSFESRVLVQARRFKELGAATGEDLPEIETVSVAPRQLALPGIDDEEPGA